MALGRGLCYGLVMVVVWRCCYSETVTRCLNQPFPSADLCDPGQVIKVNAFYYVGGGDVTVAPPSGSSCQSGGCLDSLSNADSTLTTLLRLCDGRRSCTSFIVTQCLLPQTSVCGTINALTMQYECQQKTKGCETVIMSGTHTYHLYGGTFVQEPGMSCDGRNVYRRGSYYLWSSSHVWRVATTGGATLTCGYSPSPVAPIDANSDHNYPEDVTGWQEYISGAGHKINSDLKVTCADPEEPAPPCTQPQDGATTPDDQTTRTTSSTTNSHINPTTSTGDDNITTSGNTIQHVQPDTQTTSSPDNTSVNITGRTDPRVEDELIIYIAAPLAVVIVIIVIVVAVVCTKRRRRNKSNSSPPVENGVKYSLEPTKKDLYPDSKEPTNDGLDPDSVLYQDAADVRKDDVMLAERDDPENGPPKEMYDEVRKNNNSVNISGSGAYSEATDDPDYYNTGNDPLRHRAGGEYSEVRKQSGNKLSIHPPETYAQVIKKPNPAPNNPDYDDNPDDDLIIEENAMYSAY